MLKVLSSILCDLDPKVKVIGQKAGICDGVPSTSALVFVLYLDLYLLGVIYRYVTSRGSFIRTNHLFVLINNINKAEVRTIQLV